MYSERGELDEVFRRITLPDTVKEIGSRTGNKSGPGPEFKS